MDVTLTISPRRVAWTLGAIVLLLAVGNFARDLFPLTIGLDAVPGEWWVVRYLDLDREGNLPTWFSTCLLLAAAVLLAATGYGTGAGGGRDRRHWFALAAVFTAMSLDEATSVHEMLSEPVRTTLHTGGVFYYGWVVPGLAFVAVMFVLFARFLWRLPPATRWRFALAGGVYVLGAVGIELWGGAYAEQHGNQTLAYRAISGLEETLEMSGIVLFLHALLLHAARFGRGFRVVCREK